MLVICLLFTYVHVFVCVERHIFMCACAYGDLMLMSRVFFGQPPPQMRQGLSLSLDLTVLTSLASQFTLGIPSLLLPNARTTGVGGGHDPMTFNIKKIKRFVLMFTSVCAPVCMCLMCTGPPPLRKTRRGHWYP